MSDEIELQSPPSPAIDVDTTLDSALESLEDELVLEILGPPESTIDVWYPAAVEGIEISEPAIIIQGGGGLASWVSGETPTGAINGTNVDYITANVFQTGSLAVYVNGLRMKNGLDYTITGTKNFRIIGALLTGDSLIVDYILP